MEIKIEKGIPIPLPRSKPIGAITQALRTMDIGDSFFVTVVKQSALTVHFFSARRANPTLVFKTRKVTENGITGVRIWRVE